MADTRLALRREREYPWRGAHPQLAERTEAGLTDSCKNGSTARLFCNCTPTIHPYLQPCLLGILSQDFPKGQLLLALLFCRKSPCGPDRR
ncbi:MAG TPA: hypothetical protein PLL48_16585, partial [Novosphingobium sp.]|nr:hypothetical protein [Novosphingobium sp.]